MRFLVWLGRGLTGRALVPACVLLSVLLIASALLPFMPFEVRTTRVVPPSTCPNGPVMVSLDRTWREPNLFFGIGEVEVESYWQGEPASQGVRYPSVVATVGANYETPDGWARSNLVREAPDAPGEYRLYTDYTVRGRTLLLPSYQEVETKSEDVIEVRRCGR